MDGSRRDPLTLFRVSDALADHLLFNIIYRRGNHLLSPTACMIWKPASHKNLG
jgi:hypothetical protein